MVTLSDTEARQVAGIISGMNYMPKALDSASITLDDPVIEWYKIEPDPQAIGKTIGQLQVRQMTGSTMMAIIEQDGRKRIDPGPDRTLTEDATLVVAGARQQAQAFKRLIAYESPSSMDHIVFEVGPVLVLVAAATMLSARLRFPVVPFLILAGIAVGPHLPKLGSIDLRYIQSAPLMAFMGWLGILFLSLYLGSEFSLGRLIRAGRSIVAGGTIYIPPPTSA